MAAICCVLSHIIAKLHTKYKKKKDEKSGKTGRDNKHFFTVYITICADG